MGESLARAAEIMMEAARREVGAELHAAMREVITELQQIRQQQATAKYPQAASGAGAPVDAAATGGHEPTVPVQQQQQLLLQHLAHLQETLLAKLDAVCADSAETRRQLIEAAREILEGQRQLQQERVRCLQGALACVTSTFFCSFAKLGYSDSGCEGSMYQNACAKALMGALRGEGSTTMPGESYNVRLNPQHLANLLHGLTGTKPSVEALRSDESPDGDIMITVRL